MPFPEVTTRSELRRALGETHPGFVPTMGALHEGHGALIERAAKENEQTVVSIFVNPSQFGDSRDLAQYPRNLEQDCEIAGSAGASLIFAPTAAEVYPPGFDTWIEPGELAQRWEGSARPGHFRGVATVVAILLNLVRPARAYFGEKDFQQLQIIRRMHADLALPGDIVGCPTVRDTDGLALSSRNARLSSADRQRAQAIPHAIAAVIQAANDGESDASKLERVGRTMLDRACLSVDYLAMVDPATLHPIAKLDRPARLLLAAAISDVRLIDNAEVVPSRGAER